MISSRGDPCIIIHLLYLLQIATRCLDISTDSFCSKGTQTFARVAVVLLRVFT
jgi:hypothetical protein